MKKVGYSYYVHISAIKQLTSSLDTTDIDFLQQVLQIGNKLGINYVIVKFNKQNQTVSLIECATWDSLNEPIVGDSYCFNRSLSYKMIKGGTKVYHNKWQFVDDNYKGFDINYAKRRTKEWNTIKEIKSYKSKIGNKEFWYQLLKENNLSI